MAREIAKAYEPQRIEPSWAEKWVKEELFKADPSKPGPVFSIVIPPPNVTGSLHIGHMLDHTEIDILTRWHRMCGYNTLYLPGTDHAGISTQRVVVKQLADQGINYRDLGREEFVRRVWQWKEESGGTIQRQMREIGESCDWTREKFTLSPELSRVVIEVFVRLYEEGLIYRDKRMTNWCPVCLTVLSDLEVLHEERQGHLWHIKYPVAGSKEFLVVATTRPETMLGDTAIAVHPEDERYKHLIGRSAIVPLVNREIPIIGDEMVDREFGTGAVKITPAHDPNDFEAGRRHNLAEIDVMTRRRQDERRRWQLMRDLIASRRAKRSSRICKRLGLLEKVTDHTHAIGICERSRTVVEPRASTQWFCKMKPLAEPAIAAVERTKFTLFPTTGAKNSSTGCAIFATGPCRASFGGAIAFRRGIARNIVTSSWRARRRRSARNAAQRSSRRTKMCSTRGSARGCGRFRLWAGPTRRLISNATTRRRCSSPATTFCFSGLRAWPCLGFTSRAKCHSERCICTRWFEPQAARKCRSPKAPASTQ